MFDIEHRHEFLTGDVGVAAAVLKMETGTKMHMKEWLIAQIESGKYRGLSWENEEKSMFRIPWKHAAKKDYSQTADAALFKVRDFLPSPDPSPVVLSSYCIRIQPYTRITSATLLLPAA